MDLLAILARAFDTKGYPNDKNPKNWKTISGAHVHLDKNGNYDGGANGKFKGKHHWGPGYKEKDKSATSIASILAGLSAKKEESKPERKPEPPKTTGEDLRKYWARVVKYQVAMKQGKTEATWKKNAEKLKQAIKDYEDLRAGASPDVAASHKPKVAAMKSFAEKGFTPKKAATTLPSTTESPIVALGKATEAGTPHHPFTIWDHRRRKDAKIAATPKDADSTLRGTLEKVWSKAKAAEKEAAFVYSYSFKQFQEPLRGTVYGSGRTCSLEDMPWEKLGVRSMGKKPGEVKRYIQNLTSLIDRSSYDKDISLVRGNGYDGVSALFGIPASTLRTASVEELEKKLVGKQGKDEGFGSCGSSVGGGFDDKDVVMHVACPAGTKMLYMEPFAAYGGSSPYTDADLARMYSRKEKPKPYWDGKSKAKKFGKQDETVLQRGTTFQATGVKREGGKLHIYIQVVSQDPFEIK